MRLYNGGLGSPVGRSDYHGSSYEREDIDDEDDLELLEEEVLLLFDEEDEDLT